MAHYTLKNGTIYDEKGKKRSFSNNDNTSKKSYYIDSNGKIGLINQNNKTNNNIYTLNSSINENLTTLNSNLKKENKKLSNLKKDFYTDRENVSNKILSNKNINYGDETVNQTLERQNNILNPNNKKIDRTLKANEKMSSINEANKTPEMRESLKNIDIQQGEVNLAEYNKNVKEVQEKKINGYDKSLGRLFGGAFSNISNLESPKYTYDDDGNKIYLKNRANLMEEKVSNSYENGFTKFLGEAVSQIGRIGSATILDTIAPGMGTGTYWTSMFSGSYKDAKLDGYDDKNAAAYAIISTAAEFITGKILGSATSKLTGGKTSELKNLIKNSTSKIISNEKIANFIANAGSEATEEFIQEFIDRANRNLTLGENEKVFSAETLQNALYSSAMGALTGGILGGNDTDVENSNETELSKLKVNKTNNDDLTKIPTKNDIAYQYEISENPKITNFRKSMADNNFNNSNDAHNFAKSIEKIIADKNYNVVFDNTISNLDNRINAKITTLSNGEVEIKLNPNSTKTGEFLIMHEVTHAIETQEIKKLIIDYASKHNDFNEALNNLKNVYGTNDVSSEVVADISAQLFGNQEFINNLSLERPNIFKRIYNSIISIANKITGNSNEALFIKDLKNKWETAYRTQFNNLNNTSFSIDGNNKLRYNSIEEAVNEDVRKAPYQNYSNSVEFFNLDYNTMKKAIAIGSKYALEAQNMGLDSYSFNDEKYIYDFDILDKSNNSFGITKVEEIQNINKELDYERKITRNSELFERQHELYERANDYDNQSIEDKGASRQISDLGKNTKTNSLVQHEINSSRNSEGELENSSFSFNENAKRYEDLKITNNIEFFKKDNGNIRVSMFDSNSNLVNQIEIYSKQDSIKQFGENIGNYIYTQASENVNKIDIDNDINTGSETDYFMNHRPTETGLTADNLINQDVETPMPVDFYEHPEYYSQTGSQYLKETMQVLNKVRNNPDAKVIIYRATTGDKINKGDWVTLSKSYAENHNQSNLNGEGNIISLEVKAKDIQFAGDDLNEFGYFPNDNTKNSINNTDKWQQYLDRYYETTGTRTNFNDIKIPTSKDINNINLPMVAKNKIANIDEVPQITPEKVSYIKDTSDYSKKLTRKEIRQLLLSEMNIAPIELSAGNDIGNINYQLTDPIRVNEKVFGRELGKKINDVTINQTKHNTAEKTRWLNKEREEIKELGIKARSKESAAVQKYGEGSYVSESGEIKTYGDFELETEFPDERTQQKIKQAALVLRNKYNVYINQINEVLTSLGYDPIPKRENYMRHFQELGDIFSQTGIPFNLNDMKAEDLPTDINGLTEFNKPGKNWFANAQERKGINTNYDAITGIDGYLEGAGNLIFHTKDIQNYRALSTLIRETFGQTKGYENLNNLSDKEMSQRIKDIQSNKLSKYVAWLDEQANSLAGKKGAIDRGVERMMGRRGYTFFNTIKKQVGSNMTGFNVRSSLTNLISSTIASAKTNKLALVKGTISTINNMFKNDGFIDKSDFLTNRFGSDSLSAKWWQKASNAGQIFMTGSDYLTSNMIVRSKYYEGLHKGMNETDAIKYADDFASRVMGDRSQGSTAEIFNSKTLGLFTQFQLEVNNQWQYMVHDSKMDFQENSKINGGLKAGATILFQLGQMATYSYFFNELFEKLTGSRAAFDPVEIFKKLFGYDDDDEEDKSWEERIGEAGSLLIDNIPFGSLLTGNGRIPISEALTPVGTTLKWFSGAKDEYGNSITLKNIGEDVVATIPYYLLPTGYSQIKKTLKGLSMYNKKLPVAGSYTDSGNLRFTADKSTSGKIKSVLFGQYSSKESQDYIDSNFKTISKNNIQEMKDLKMSSTEYRKYRTGLTKSGTTNEDKIEYINSLKNVSKKQKNIMASNVLKREVDMEEYNKYSSYEEFNYAYKNPEKHSLITSITTYDNFKKYKEKIDNIRDNSTDKKSATIKYINDLNLSIPQKAMFIRMYYTSFDKYNKNIIEYVNNKYKSKKEKEDILKELGFTIKDGRVYY